MQKPSKVAISLSTPDIHAAVEYAWTDHLGNGHAKERDCELVNKGKKKEDFVFQLDQASADLGWTITGIRENARLKTFPLSGAPGSSTGSYVVTVPDRIAYFFELEYTNTKTSAKIWLDPCVVNES